MPKWEPAATDVPSAPPGAAPTEDQACPVEHSARRSSTKKAKGPSRRVADPFDADDDGANCMRCGYAVEPARERHGLMTCSGCV
jgi:hypothetical protein